MGLWHAESCGGNFNKTGTGETRLVLCQSSFLNIREAFVPPKPNELLSAVLMTAFLASLGT